MASQWINEILWFACSHLSNFKYIAANLPDLIGPAFGSLSLLFPAFTIRSIASYYIGNVIEGDIDWISFADELESTGYEGPFLYEVSLGTTARIERPVDLTPKDFRENYEYVVQRKNPPVHNGKLLF